MNQTSPVSTGTAGAATGAVVTIISWLAASFRVAISGSAQISIAVGIVMGAHWLGKQIAARSVAKAPAPSVIQSAQ